MIIDSVRWWEFAFGIDWAATFGDNVFNSESCGMENGNTCTEIKWATTCA
jgi:hypothetical protein